MSTATEHPDVAAALRGRHFLTLDDYSADEIRYLIDLAAELKAAKRDGQRGAEARRPRDRADLREGLDAHALRVRGRRLRPGRARHVHRAQRLAHGPQGDRQGHRARARAHVRRDRVPRLRRGDRRRAGRVGRRARLQRPHRRVAPDADARRLPRRCASTSTSRSRRWRSATSATPASTWPTATWWSGAKLGMDVRIAAPRSLWPARRAGRGRTRVRRRVRRADHDHRGRRGGRRAAATSCSPTSGSRWARPTRCGRERIELLMPYQINAQTMAADRQPERQVHALPAGVPQHRDAGRQGDRARSSG